jgi:hypothetical protein
MIKKLLLLALLMFHIFSNAQESQSIIAAKWSDGKYPWFKNNNSYSNSAKPEFEQSEEVELSFKKNDNGEVIEIKLNSTKYESDSKGNAKFVRYFREKGDGGRCLFFASDECIEVYSLGPDEGKLNGKYSASIGKAGSKKGFSSFMSYLEKTKSKVADEIALYEKNKSENTIVGKVDQIQKVEHVLVTKDGKPLKSGDQFSFGFITTFKDGKVIKTKNIGGLQDIKEFKYRISYPISSIQYKYNVGTQLNDSIAPYCDYLKGEKVNLSITTSDYFFKNLAYTEFAIENCSDDPSPLVTFFRNAEENYSSLNMIYGPGLLNQEYFGKHEKYGFLLQPSEKSKYFEFEKMKEDNCFIIGEKDNKYYFLNLNGDLKSKEGYEQVNSLSEGNISLVYKSIPLYTVKKNGKYGILNYKLEEILPLEYDEIILAGKDRMVVTKGKKSTLFNTQTMVAISESYNQLVPGFDLKNCLVEQNGKFGYIDIDGKIIIEIKYDDLGFFTSNGMATARMGQKRFYINTSGGVALDEGYLGISQFNWKNVKKKGKEETLYYAEVTDKDGNKKLINQYGSTLTDEDFEGSNMPSISSTSNSSSSTSSSSSSSSSSSDSKDFSGSVYFKYDMMGSNSAPERLYIHYGSNGAYKTSTTKGSAATVKCQKGKVYYSLTGEKSDMKEFMEMSVDDCGKTFKYTDFK